MPTRSSFPLTPAHARRLWLRAQRLDSDTPFGSGPDATRQAVAHLGYVQIDTINVIERSHHHILFTRIPSYRRDDLEQAQSVEKSVFEYWAHALAYLPTADYRLFVPAMDRVRANPRGASANVDRGDYAALLRRIRKEGPLSIRDIDDDVLVEKTHPWGSRKPSVAALRFGFYSGDLTVSRRTGMVKVYELAARHFGWRSRPRPATDRQFAEYLLARALRSQAIVSLDSICYGNLALKPMVGELIEARQKRRRLVPVHLEDHARIRHWAEPSALEQTPPEAEPVHILSPFDPLVIQRKRLAMMFGYEHRFEAYVPAEQRVLGYFALPVLVGDRIAAAIDLKMDRQAGKLLVRKWTWIGDADAAARVAIEEALGRLERFQKG